MSLDRSVVILGELQRNTALSIIDANWRAMAAAGHPLAIRIYEHKEQRSIEQQALMWIRLGEISEQGWINGQQFSDESWHIYFKRLYLPEEEGPSKRCRKGYRKWASVPGRDERELVGSTTQLTTFGMSEYMEQLMAFGATELGVQFGPTPAEMRSLRMAA